MVRETDTPQPSIEHLIERFGQDVDVVLLEGFKQANVDKIEVFRPSLGKEPLFADPLRYPRIVAVASDSPMAHSDSTPMLLDLNQPEQIGEFILSRNSMDIKVSACV